MNSPTLPKAFRIFSGIRQWVTAFISLPVLLVEISKGHTQMNTAIQQLQTDMATGFAELTGDLDAISTDLTNIVNRISTGTLSTDDLAALSQVSAAMQNLIGRAKAVKDAADAAAVDPNAAPVDDPNANPTKTSTT